MKRPYLLAEVLLALILLALIAPPLISALQGRHKKALSLSQKVDKIRQFDKTKLAVLEKISSADLKELEARGRVEIQGAVLTLHKEGIRVKEDLYTYLIDCTAHGQRDLICLSRREKQKSRPKCIPHRTEGESRDSTQRGDPQSVGQ